MSQLLTLSDWINANFKSEVKIRTAQNWCASGYIPGAQKIGNLWFVDPEYQNRTTGNALVDEVLRHGS